MRPFGIFQIYHDPACSFLLLFLLLFFLSACSLATSDQVAPLPVIDSSVCKPYVPGAGESLPGKLYGHGKVGQVRVINGDFTFDFWLYCDPTLQPSDPSHYSAIAGAGVYGAWKYTGEKVDGKIQDYWGFDSDVKASTGWDGPLYKASVDGGFGISLAEDAVAQHLKQKTPVRFSIMVESPLGKKGAVFSFDLRLTQKGYVFDNLSGEAYSE